MAYVPVPKDLTHVRQKVLFNLTRRQLVCFLGGALLLFLNLGNVLLERALPFQCVIQIFALIRTFFRAQERGGEEMLQHDFQGSPFFSYTPSRMNGIITSTMTSEAALEATYGLSR